MDFEPLWSLGGWLFLFSTCMATQSPISQSNTKPQHFLLFFVLLFLLLLLLFNPTKPLNPSFTFASSISIRRFLLEPSQSFSTTSTTTTMNNMHPKRTRKSHSSSSSSSSKSKGSSEFGAKAHEVPSGPNPISNR